ncbi:MAG: SDR family oxidoreductase [Betaproteobacteria bacterium]|nr:SDR family oxidoreductase [Betaproteobacteria bacterium]NDD13512.1 SDR family oxidoreductase [Betaproteobacteria bacterium]
MEHTKVALVTGASRGIGAAIRQYLLEGGWRVIGLSRTMPFERIESKSGRSHWIACDMTQEASLRNSIAQAVSHWGRLDALINNAGLHLSARSETLSLADFDAVMNINTRALVIACQAAFNSLCVRGGCIVNIGSFFDKLGVKGNLAYCASKAAVGAITRCLAVEWAAQNIRVVNIAPGYIYTDLNAEALQGKLEHYLAQRIPSGGPGSALEVASLVGSVLSQPGMFLTGSTIYLDGGQAIAH